MKSPLHLILFLLLLVLAGLFAGFVIRYRVPEPVSPLGGLDWLRVEFELSEEQFLRISELHNDYLPICEINCDRVMEAQERLDAKLMNAVSYNEEVEEELARFSRLKEECHREMLRYFYDVAAVMRPDQRERYMEKAKKHVTLHDRVLEPVGVEMQP